MVRETMAWYRCDICGRRGLFFYCRLGARKLHVCPYCLLALSNIAPLRCSQEAREYLERVRAPISWAGESLAERVRERLEDGASRSRASRR